MSANDARGNWGRVGNMMRIYIDLWWWCWRTFGGFSWSLISTLGQHTLATIWIPSPIAYSLCTYSQRRDESNLCLHVLVLAGCWLLILALHTKWFIGSLTYHNRKKFIINTFWYSRDANVRIFLLPFADAFDPQTSQIAHTQFTLIFFLFHPSIAGRALRWEKSRL